MRERFLAQALLAASLWIAVKWEATRSTTPDGAIMSRITGEAMARSNVLSALQVDRCAVKPLS